MALSALDLSAALRHRSGSNRAMHSPRLSFSPRTARGTLSRSATAQVQSSQPLADLTGHELQKARAAFEAQKAHGPVRSLQQLTDLLLAIGEAPSEAELAGMTQYVDFMDGQVLDWPRFHTILRLSKAAFLQLQGDREAETREAFGILGPRADEGGGLPTAHLQSLIEGYGLRLDVKDVARRELRPSIADDSVLTFDQFAAIFGAEALKRSRQEADRAALQKVLPTATLKLRAIQKVREMTIRKHQPQATVEAHNASQRDSLRSDDGVGWNFDLERVHTRAEDLRRQLDTCVPAFRADLPRRRRKGPALPHLQAYLRRRVEDRLYPHHERPATRLSALNKQLAEMEEATGIAIHPTKRSERSAASTPKHYMTDCQCTKHTPRSSQPEPFSVRSSVLTLDSSILPFLAPPEGIPAGRGRADDPPEELPASLGRPPSHHSHDPHPLDESAGSSFPPIPERSTSRAGRDRAAAQSSSQRGRPPWDPRPLNLDAITAQARHGGRTSPPRPPDIPAHLRPATQEYARQLCLAALLMTDQVDEAAAELENLRAAHAIGLQAQRDQLARSQQPLHPMV